MLVIYPVANLPFFLNNQRLILFKKAMWGEKKKKASNVLSYKNLLTQTPPLLRAITEHSAAQGDVRWPLLGKAPLNE